MAIDVMMFGKRLRASRDKQGLSQSELARLSGVGQNQISNLEAGKKPRVSLDVVARLCLALHISADYLLGLQDATKENDAHMSEMQPAMTS